jgi:hypothetical protein
MRRMPRITPSMAVALTALVFAMSGAGYAATQLTAGHAQAAKKKKKKVKVGPQGPQGPAGATGPAGASASFGVVNGVVGTQNANIGAPVGISNGVNNVTSAMLMLTPNAPIMLRDLSAYFPSPEIVNTGTYTVEFTVGYGVETDLSCTIAAAPNGNGHSCNSGGQTVTIPAGSQLGVDVVPGGTAVPPSGSVEFGYRATTP